MAIDIQIPESDWFRDWVNKENQKRSEEAQIQLDLPLPEPLPALVEDKPTLDRGVYNDALESSITDALESTEVKAIIFRF